MALPDHLIKAALLGTQKESFSAESVLGEATALSLQNESPEAQLLLAAATLKLREKAGYTAAQSHLPLPSVCEAESLQPCSPQAARILHLMLSGGVHRYALKEWLIEAARARRQAPVDLLPNLLLLGLKQPSLRPYLLHVLGQRGSWLGLEIINQNWKWPFNLDLHSVDGLIAFDRHYEFEVIRALKKNFLNEGFQALASWLKHRLVWSDELTNVFLQSLEAIQKPQWSTSWWVSYYGQRILPYAYFFPLHRTSEIQQRIKGAAAFGADAQDLTERIGGIADFRTSMIQAFHTHKERP
jgi:hypothetical protein